MKPMKDNECEIEEVEDEKTDDSTYSFFQTKEFLAS